MPDALLPGVLREASIGARPGRINGELQTGRADAR
jgi:hypothetical protein